MGLLPLLNELVLFVVSVGIAFCLYEELFREETVVIIRKTRKQLSPKYAPILVPPVFSGSVVRNTYYMDLLSLSRYIPCNAIMSNAENERTENTVKRAPRPTSTVVSDTPLKGTLKDGDDIMLEVCKKVSFPFMPGCDPTGSNALALAAKYPMLTRPDIVRFLVARKGVLAATEEMITKYLAWRTKNFPLKRNDVMKAFKTNCFFPYGVARDGSPIVYMRGGLYDCNVASPEEYVMAAAYTIDWSLKQHPDQTNVTVIVHTATVAEGPNQSADTNFIKLFIQVLSDNYPERLKRLAIFPFPWYGRAIWGMLKVFVDKRTQDKVMLLSDGSKEIPAALKEFLDPRTMPRFVGGSCDDPIPDLLETLE